LLASINRGVNIENYRFNLSSFIIYHLCIPGNLGMGKNDNGTGGYAASAVGYLASVRCLRD